MPEEDKACQTQKQSQGLRELNEHLPEWIRLLKELYVSESSKKNQEDNIYL